MDLQFDIFANDPPKEFGEVVNRFILMEGLQLGRLFSAEQEQLPGQVRGPLGGAQDLVQIAARPFSQVVSLQHHVQVALHDRQEVVEVMRYSAGQAADRVHLLDLPQLFLNLFAVRDVANET